VKKFVKWWLPVVVWMSVIFFGSSIGNLPLVGSKTSDQVVHRIAHLLEFAVLGAVVLRAVTRDRLITKREIILTAIITALYGASDEFHQRFTPGRSSEGLSVLFDAAGGLIGAWVWRWWKSPNRRRMGAVPNRRIDEATQQRVGE
jgi:VanZ family protein